jgi:DNA polymerase III alpha subunit (gram-positive type)
MKKKIFIDVETGGLNPKANPLLQLSGEVEIEGETVEEFNFFIAPFEGQIASKKALEVNGLTPEQIKNFMRPQNAFTSFVNLLDRHISKFNKKDKAFFIGYNSRFDEEFTREFFLRNSKTEADAMFGNGYGCYFWTPSIDVMQMAALKLAHIRGELPNFQLRTVCTYLGYDENVNWHDAKADIIATKWLFYKLLKMKRTKEISHRGKVA